MALVMGTNCGFVTEAPIADPTGDATGVVDDFGWATKDTSPIGAVKVVEMGWWCDDATPESNFEMGIYDHNSGDNNPEAVVGALSQTNAKGTDAGWKRITGLNISITAETIYWLALQLDDTTPNTNTDRTTDAGEKADFKLEQTTLTNPWGVSAGSVGRIYAIYAVVEVEEPPATNIQINISDVWKDVDSIQINIGDVWKDVIQVQQNIGDFWKTVFG